MKLFTLLVASLLLQACANEDKYAEQPVAPWTYPISEYRVIQTQAGRPTEVGLTRLVGWDEGFYYFDWSQKEAVIGRGTGRVDRKQFDLENRGALTLEKGPVTLSGGQVRTVLGM
ncbi:hypothetical protein [Roseibacillus ishigakijimensis]|uniref:Uncharacterized protein n=1 Tax=Roseibacillus ishigakijimensis TaxID=454146 RepID=A0A934VGU4_9BACT|nr:hypothetical protein [Roseibacillus ishigakijimensis]MBK1833238.1 hypothetical protein [Roseibacillus ishigakijimensis]